MTGLAADLGLALPDAEDLVRAGAALVVIVLTIVAAWLVGRWSGPVLADFWERRIGTRAGAMKPMVPVSSATIRFCCGAWKSRMASTAASQFAALLSL